LAFSLHPQLAKDSLPVARLPLSDLLLLNDHRFPWCILVPRMENLRELHDLPQAQGVTLFEEIESVSRTLQQVVDAYKINVGALGNIVTQLHIHIVARFPQDPAWPGPVWGFGAAEPYSESDANDRITALQAYLPTAL
jgi:diadenosine tetraphosphate (Ap4A) HIT family hydrolase